MTLLRIVLTVSFVSVFIAAFTQTNSPLIQKASDLYDSGDYLASGEMYEQAFSKEKVRAGDYYNAACAFSLAKRPEKALRYLERGFSMSAAEKSQVVSASHLLKDTDLDNIRNLRQFQKLVGRYYHKDDLEFHQTKEIDFQTLVRYINLQVEQNAFQITIEDKIIHWERDSAGNTVVNSPTTFYANKLKNSDNVSLKFVNCDFRFHFMLGQRFGNLNLNFLSFDNCTFQHHVIFMQLNLKNPFNVRKCTFNGNFYASANILSPYRDIDHDDPSLVIDSCQINSKRFHVDAYSETPISIRFTNNQMPDSLALFFTGNVAGLFQLKNNVGKKAFVKIDKFDINGLDIQNTHFKSIYLLNSQINAKFNFNNSSVIDHFLIGNTTFNENPSNQLRWKAFRGLKLGMLKEYKLVGYDKDQAGIFETIFVDGSKEQDFVNEDDYANLLGIYSLFLNQYRSNSDLESYNECFIAVKELQSKRLKYLHETNAGFESYFRWKLSQLMKFYVRYGTDPARAIVISIYIVAAFGVFFFFFPSDWDVASKTILIQNYKDFVEKNEKGYFVPFLILVKGIFASLLNALTLSLNAFITLGFGNIPTHGVARYICVLEGFIGWFLLSIFTVSLINQTL